MPGYRKFIVVCGGIFLIAVSITWSNRNEIVDLASEYGLAENVLGADSNPQRSGWSPYENVEDRSILNNLATAPAWVRHDYGVHESDDSPIPPAPAWARADISASHSHDNAGVHESHIAEDEEAALHWSSGQEVDKTRDMDKTDQFIKRARQDERQRWAHTLFTKQFLKSGNQRTRGSGSLSSGDKKAQTSETRPVRSEPSTSEDKAQTKGAAPATTEATSYNNQAAAYRHDEAAALVHEAARARAMEDRIQQERARDRAREALRDSALLAHLRNPARPAAAASAAAPRERLSAAPATPAADEGRALRAAPLDEALQGGAAAPEQRRASAAPAGPATASTSAPGGHEGGARGGGGGAEALPRERARGEEEKEEEERLSRENARLVKSQSALLDLLAASENR